MNSINIFDVFLDNLTIKQLWDKLEEFITSDSNHLVVTVNAEFTLLARKNELFRNILNGADLSLPDGSGPALAALTYGKKIKRHVGADLTANLLNYAQKNKLPVVVINWCGGLSTSSELTEKIKSKYPELNILIIDTERNGELNENQSNKIASFQPVLMFSTLGAPWQEYFLDNNRNTFKTVRLMVGVGGSFDFLINKVKRAPLLWRQLGIEFLWRLIQQPQRWRRIWNAVPVFLITFLKWRYFEQKKNR
jgi:N-acetylglucosaminyldiphosphoundecaprenol N-acetyl-beta-D-mannosaminyltransferase